MVGDGALVVLVGGPARGQSVVDVLEDLVGGLVRPLGGGAGRAVAGGGGLHGVGVVDQAGGAVVGQADVDVGVHVLVVSHAHAILQQVIQAAADVVGSLHILEHDPQGGGKDMGLIDALVHAGLHDGNAVCAACRYGPVACAAGHAVGHRHGGHIVHPAAAGFNDDIAGVGEAGQGLADHGIPLLQLTDQECAAGSDARGVHDGRAGNRRGRSRLAADHAGVESADILKAHNLPPVYQALARVRMTSSAIPLASAGPPHWQLVRATVLPLSLLAEKPPTTPVV